MLVSLPLYCASVNRQSYSGVRRRLSWIHPKRAFRISLAIWWVLLILEFVTIIWFWDLLNPESREQLSVDSFGLVDLSFYFVFLLLLIFSIFLYQFRVWAVRPYAYSLLLIYVASGLDGGVYTTHTLVDLWTTLGALTSGFILGLSLMTGVFSDEAG